MTPSAIYSHHPSPAERRPPAPPTPPPALRPKTSPRPKIRHEVPSVLYELEVPLIYPAKANLKGKSVHVWLKSVYFHCGAQTHGLWDEHICQEKGAHVLQSPHGGHQSRPMLLPNRPLNRFDLKRHYITSAKGSRTRSLTHSDPCCGFLDLRQGPLRPGLMQVRKGTPNQERSIASHSARRGMGQATILNSQSRSHINQTSTDLRWLYIQVFTFLMSCSGFRLVNPSAVGSAGTIFDTSSVCPRGASWSTE
jgi:hypothetical protein